MPNDLYNKLEIYCPEKGIMSKIKMVLFDYKENQQIFTMKKLLPRPEEFSTRTGYDKYGYDWGCAVWGTKWDVYDYIIIESGDTILIDYYTAWSPNYKWGLVLCEFVQQTVLLNEFEITNPIHITHQFYDYPMDFAGILEWKPHKLAFY